MQISDQQRTISYVLVSLTWLLVVLNCLFPFPIDGLRIALNWIGIVMAVTHLIEVIVFFPKIKPYGNTAYRMLMVFLFGIIYVSGLNSDDVNNSENS